MHVKEFGLPCQRCCPPNLNHNVPASCCIILTGRRCPCNAAPAGVVLCFVAVDGSFAGLICAQDGPRPEAAEAVRRLEHLGCSVAMLTGDGRGVAKAMGEATGVRPGHVHAALLPRDKLDLVRCRGSRGGRSLAAVVVGGGCSLDVELGIGKEAWAGKPQEGKWLQTGEGADLACVPHTARGA
jgi:hypothetical protein